MDGIVKLLGVLYDRDECMLDKILSLVMMGGECGAETVDESGPVGRGELIVPAGDRLLAKCRDEKDGATRQGGRSRKRARPSGRRDRRQAWLSLSSSSSSLSQMSQTGGY